MDFTQIVLCLSILLLRSAAANSEFGRRDKRNLDIRQYLERVVTGMDDFQEQLSQQENAIQLLSERYAELVVKHQELVEQGGKLASKDEDLAIQAANQNASLQERNAELTYQIKQLTNHTQELFRLNALNAKREEALVKQNTELTRQLAQVRVDLNQTKELQNTISSTIVTQAAQMHNFSIQNDQFQNSLRENVAEVQQSSKNKSAVLDRKIDKISAESQQNLSRAEDVLSKKLNSTEVLLREYTVNQVNQLTKQISHSADVAKQEVTTHIRDINARLTAQRDSLPVQPGPNSIVTFHWYPDYKGVDRIPEEINFGTSLCSRSECCRNLGRLNDFSASLRTRDVCVVVYLDKNCSGDSRFYGRHSSIPHLRDFTNKISSVKPVNC